MAFLQNRWYMAGWSNEFSSTTLKARTLVGWPLVLFRNEKGEVCALHDRCPHRFAPLHLGSIIGTDRIQCGYHGLEFNGAGRCVHNPHGDGRIPAAAVVRSFPVQERHGMVWFWPGNPELADLQALPDYTSIDEALCHVSHGYQHVKANYVLESDNILDLSHVQFLHPHTLGSGAVSAAKAEVSQEGETVHCVRRVQSEDPMPFVRMHFQLAEHQLADRWMDVRWDPPASMLLTVTVSEAGYPREAGRTIRIPHVFTPETETTTHYFFASCFEKRTYPDGADRAKSHLQGLLTPFLTEDAPMLEAQQQVIGDADFWSLKPVLLSGDAAAVRARRVLDGLLLKEQERSHTPGHAIPVISIETTDVPAHRA
ncbi:vanillate O-demethylase monooxygenase subunit [Pseudomonas sp. NFIX10]|uniref:aromatic ring-hydroxylating dioxygenase subunit alpha n=1 Tax=unclassified Pseudomonas TaxID=196821 RepID=UPI0008EB6DA9|nr:MULTISPECIES: aromatic ring-hydroxylating dioxygenase subunit alpha [unclassified Pseudomonas]SFA92470.1 vanillate O-demethylase monooxygenase subunit [Pseudomonas sp. NFIX10]SFE37893.1 vanillate O-demethylase monooxygenase subunit [Pseudomonas sp. NFACC06-1]